MLSYCESESTLNCTCLIILSYIAVYNPDTYAHVSSASVSNAGMSFVMLICIWKLQYGKSLIAVKENNNISARKTL